MAGDAQPGVDARAVRREFAVALIAGGGEHDVARTGGAAGRHEVEHAGRFRIGAVGLLDRHPVRQARLIADVQRLAVRIGAWRGAGIRRGVRDVGGKGIGVVAVALVHQRAEGKARGQALLDALYRSTHRTVDVVLPASRLAVRSRHQLGDIEAQVRGHEGGHACAGSIGDSEVDDGRAVGGHRSDVDVESASRHGRGCLRSEPLRLHCCRRYATTSGQCANQEARCNKRD